MTNIQWHKFQKVKGLGHWGLIIGDYLELGIWQLGFEAQTSRKEHSSQSAMVLQ